MSVNIGSVTLTGADGTVALGSISGSTSRLQAVNFTDEFKKVDWTDGDGQIKGKNYYGRENTLSLDVIFYGSTKATAASNTLLLNLMGAVATIASTAVPAIDGTWNFEGGTYTGSVGTAHKYTINLWRGGSDTAPASMAVAS